MRAIFSLTVQFVLGNDGRCNEDMEKDNDARVCEEAYVNLRSLFFTKKEMWLVNPHSFSLKLITFVMQTRQTFVVLMVEEKFWHKQMNDDWYKLHMMS